MPALSRALKASLPQASRLQARVQGQILSNENTDPITWAFVGGALIADLDLRANFTFAFDCAAEPAPDWLESELASLFEAAGVPLDSAWAESRPACATPLACLAARVGRALAADPDGLVIEAATWPGDLIAPETFERAYRTRYPWRGLRWLDGSQA